MKAIATVPGANEEIVVGGYTAVGDGGGGVFAYRTGAPAAYDNGIYFKPDTISGYFERIIPGDFVHVAWFGASKDLADATAPLDAALAAGGLLGKKVVSDKTTYKVSGTLHVRGDVDFNGATLYYSAPRIDRLVEQKAEGDILGLNIDGSGVANCQYGLFVDTDYPTTKVSRYRMRIENLKNGDIDQSCNGAVFSKSADAKTNLDNKYDISISCKNIKATDGGRPIGSNAGSAAGILFSMNGLGTAAQVHIHDLEIDGVGPVKDSLGVCVFTGDYQDATARGQFVIENVIVRNCLKRGIKIQAPNTIVTHVTAYCDNSEIGFDTYSFGTQFVACRAVNTLKSGFYTDFKDTLIRDCEISTAAGSTPFPLVVAQANASGLQVDNVQMTLNRDFDLANEIAVISILTTGDVLIRNIDFKTGKQNGTFLATSAPGLVCLDNVIVEGLAYGVVTGNVPGKVQISNSSFKSGFDCLRTKSPLGSPATFYIHNTSLEGKATAVNLEGGAFRGLLYMSDCQVKTELNGILAAPGSGVRNTRVENTKSKTGAGISIQNGQVDGCRVKNFTDGVVFAYSVQEEITNNTTIACTNGFVNIGVVTPYVYYNNVSK